MIGPLDLNWLFSVRWVLRAKKQFLLWTQSLFSMKYELRLKK